MCYNDIQKEGVQPMRDELCVSQYLAEEDWSEYEATCILDDFQDDPPSIKKRWENYISIIDN